MSEWSPESPMFLVLFVSTGNLCRSPIAEYLLRDRLAERGEWIDVRSAGLEAEDGRPMDFNAARALASFGVEGGEIHRTVPLTPELVTRADLVLTGDRSQRRDVATVVPGSWERTFTMREFARIALTLPAPETISPTERAHAVVKEAMSRRTAVLGASPDEDDIYDPVGNPYRYFRRVAVEINETVDVISAVLLSSSRILRKLQREYEGRFG